MPKFIENFRKLSVYLQIAYLCSTWRVAGGGRVNRDGPACCSSPVFIRLRRTQSLSGTRSGFPLGGKTAPAARPRRRGLLETMEIEEGRARLGERTHFSVPGRFSRKGGPGSIHSQTQPLSSSLAHRAALSGGASSGAPFEGNRSESDEAAVRRRVIRPSLLFVPGVGRVLQRYPSIFR